MASESAPVRRLRILQISDLHIGSWGRRAVLDQLRQIVRQEAPNLLVASGDQANHPFPWSMRRAAVLLSEMCQRENDEPIPLVSLAGNHDYKLWGNVGLRRLSRVPFHVYFRADGLSLGWWSRCKLYSRLAMHALWPWSAELQDELVCAGDAERGLCLVGFESNSLAEMMAAGKVDARSLQEFSSRLAAWLDTHEFDSAFKVAVVHHHPAPIPFVATDATARLQESFMVLYNAGTLMRTLYDAGFQLVLHGHKHFAGFSRVSYATDPSELHTLAVAAAGSAGHPRPDDPSGNHLYIIDVFDDDTVEIESRYFDESVVRKDTTRCYVVQDLASVRRSRRRILERRSSLRVDRKTKVATITPDGYTNIAITFSGCEVVEGSLDGHPCRIRIPSPTYLRDVRPVTATAMPRFLELARNEERLRFFDGRYEFKETFVPESPAFDFGVSFRLMNGHALSRQEFQREYAGTTEQWEYSSLQCDAACSSLRSEVVFPQGFDMQSVTEGVEVCYEAAPVHHLDDFPSDAGIRNHDEEKRRVGDVRKEGNRLVLEVTDPVPAFVYRIRWRYGEPTTTEETVPAEVESIARANNKILLDLADRWVAGDRAARRTYKGIRLTLANLAKELESSDFLVPPRRSAAIDLSLMAYDFEARRLRFVALSFADLGTLHAQSFVPGEGCAGFSFEKARSLLYVKLRDSIGYFIHPREWPGGPGGLLDQQCMISVPWVYPGVSGQNITVGVLNIGSRALDSPLLGLAALKPAEWDRKAQELAALTAATGSAIVNSVRASVET